MCKGREVRRRYQAQSRKIKADKKRINKRQASVQKDVCLILSCPVSVYLIPDNLVLIQIQLKAFSVSFVDNGALRLVGIVYHAVFAVFGISMNVHIVVA